ncbi:MAG: TAXI family TRAP transporter solute-binding subunit [Deltaproteobacteria bacterium]|nr:TAXI family TRAP transporter solute-binding subunit [Candidatus Zymogenaceae bacterium]
MKLRAAVCSGILVGILVAWSGLGAHAAGPIRLATGPAGDFFWIMGKELCRVWSAEDLAAEVVETTGDRENLALVVSGKADAALVSGFALADFLAEQPGAPVVTVASCWKSAVHVMLNNEFIKTDTLRDLEGRHLYLGPEASPYGNAVRRILAGLGIKPYRYVREIAKSELLGVMTDFIGRELDGAVIVGPVADPMVRDIVGGTGGIMGLIPADQADVSALSGAGLPVFALTIPKETYPYQTEDLVVIGVGTYLVARPDLSDETARKLAAGIFDNAGRIAAYFPRGGTLSVEEAAAHPVAPLHPGLK